MDHQRVDFPAEGEPIREDEFGLFLVMGSTGLVGWGVCDGSRWLD